MAQNGSSKNEDRFFSAREWKRHKDIKMDIAVRSNRLPLQKGVILKPIQPQYSRFMAGLPDGIFSDQFGYILEGLGKENVGIIYGHLEYFTYGHLVYFMAI
jgi:hypothetical protein